MDSFKDVNVNASLEEAKKLIGERKFINADEVLERVLFSDRENSEAYLLKLVIDLQLTSVDELKDQLEPLESRINYQRAYEFADEKQRAKLNKINEEIKKNAGQADLARQYNLAMNYKSDGRYQEAEQVFNQILEYKDAKAQAAECLKQVQSSIYQKAIDAKQSRDYDEAISLFEKIIDYSDSKAQLKECRDTIAASTYERAMQLKEEKHYDRAIPYFQKISGYKDADEQVKACERLQEEARQEAIYVTCLFTGEIDPYKHASKLKESCTKLATIPGYKDADQLLAKYQNILDEYEKELERKREEKAKARAKAKKKAKKVAIFTAIGAALITAGLLLTFLYFVPENRQTTWQKRVNDASTKDDYQQIIDEIGTNDYGDSTNLVAMAKAGQEFEAGRYESGIDYIYNIGGSVDVKYDGNGGTPAKGTETIKKTTSQAYIENTSSKKGYNENCRWVLTEYDLNASKHYASLKLKADYDLKPDKIIYDLKGGTKASNSPNQYDYEHATKIPNPTRTGYTFLGWTVNNESDLKVDYTIPINNAGTWNLTANWEANKYTVNISDLNGGTAAKTSYEVTYDGSYSITAPTRVGYTFVRFVVVKDGKETTETVPTSGTWTYPSNYSLKAIWSARTDITYTVKHYQEPVAGGNYSDYVLTDTDQKRGTADAEVLISTLTKNYTGFEYKDVANNNNTNKTKITVKPDGSLSVDLYYSRRSYTLSFVGNGGDIKNGTETVSSPITLKYGAQIPNTITVSREGSTFGGWYTDVGQTTKFTTMPAQNTTVYAYYSEETKASSFVYQETNNSVKITGNNGLTGEVVVPQYINNKPVTEIGDNAFKNNTGIASIVLPENVTKIGASAFEGCNVLTAGPDLSNIVTIGNNAFKDCTSMTTITLGEPLSSIGNYAFANCSSLLQLPDISGVTTIGNHAFDGCVNLSEIKGLNGCATFGEGILTACENLAKLTISFKEVVEQFYIARLFSNNSTISNTDKYYLPDNYSSYLVPKALKTIEYTGGERIPAYLLFGLSYVETFTDNSTSTVGVGEYAFYSCSALTDPLDLTNVTSIGEYAFSGVLAFTSITLSDSLTSIGQGAFSGCSNVTALTVPFLGSDETNANDLGYIFGKTNYTGSYSATQKNGTYYLPSSLTSLTIKGGIIAEKAIANASSLTSIEIGDSITSVADGALAGCNSLEDLSLPRFFTGQTGTVLSDDYSYTGAWSFTGSYFYYTGYGTAYHDETITFKQDGQVSLEFYVSSTSYVTCYIYKNGSSVATAYSTTSHYNTSLNVTKDDTLMFRFYSSSTSLTRTAYVYMSFYVNDTSPWAIFGTTSYSKSYGDSDSAIKHYIPSSLKTITVKSQEEIPDNAFKNLSSLTRVNISENTTSIGEAAFKGCTNLVGLNGKNAINIPEGVTRIEKEAFASDAAIVSVNFNNAITFIGESAFESNSSLTNLELPSSLVTIGKKAFNGVLVTSLNLPDSLKEIGESAFEGCSTLTKVKAGESSSLTTIGSKVFKDCSSLLSVPVLTNVTSIGSYAFSGCTMLTSVSGLSNVTTIGSYAFSSCTALGDIVDFDALVSIGNYAFSGCNSLGKVTFPESLVSIGNYAFENCLNLTDVSSFDHVEKIGNYAFYNDISLFTLPASSTIETIGEYAFANCSLLTTVSTGLFAEVGKGAFSKCPALVSASIPFSSTYTFYDYFGSNESFSDDCIYRVAYTGSTYYIPGGLVDLEIKASSNAIAAGALYNCDQITKLKIDYSIKTIGTYAFYNCSGLTELSIPDSVTSIGTYALAKCSKIEELEIPFVGTSLSSGVSFGTIFGTSSGAGLYSAYQKNTTYYLPSSLTKLTVNGGSITANACANMTSITDLVLGDSITTISDGAFSGCNAIKDINALRMGGSLSSIYGSSGSWTINSGLYTLTNSNATTYDETISFYKSGTVKLAYSVDSETYVSCTILKNNTQIGTVSGTLETKTLSFDVTSSDSLIFRWKNTSSGNSVTATVKMAFIGGECGSLNQIFGTSSYSGSYIASNGSTNYYVPSSLKTVTIRAREISNNAFRNCTSLTKVTIPSNTTSIGSYAFYNCANMASLNETNAIKVPTTVTAIGSYAFAECKSAATVVVGGSALSIGEYAFQNCTLINSLTLSKGISSIGNYAFYNNISLTTLSVPASVTSIGNYAFYGASSLTKVNIEDKSLLNNLGQFSFASCTALTEFLFDGTSSLQTIGNSAFSDSSLVTKWGKDELDTITIPAGTTSIGSSAFANMPIITKVRIADTVTSVGSSAFSGCSSIKDLTTPAIFGSTSSTGYNYSGSWSKSGDTFSYSSSGTTTINETITFTSSGKVDLQYSVNYTSYVTCFISKNGVQIYSVTGTTAVQKATINVAKNDTLTFSWKCSTSGYTRKATVVMTFTCAKTGNLGYIFGTADYAGSYKVYDGYSSNYYIPMSLKTVSVTKEDIPCYAFNNCTFLTKVVLSDEIAAINDYAFYNCTGLKSLNGDNEVIIPAAVESIGYSAFDSASAITKITIEDESLLETIGNRAFTSCASLKTFSFEGSSSLKNIGDYAFSGSSLLEKWGSNVDGAIEVPEGTETIGTYAFANLPIITSIDVADSVEYVGDYAFSGCSSLISIEMPKIYSSTQGTGYTYSGVWNYNGNYFYYTGTGTSYREETITFSSNGQVSLEYYVSSASYIYCYIYKNGSQLGSYAYGTTSHYTNNVNVVKNDYLTLRFYNTSSSYSRTAYVYLTFTPTIEYSFGRLFSANSYVGAYSNTDSHGTHYIPLSLTTVTITTGDLPANAFKDFTSLTRVNIPEDSTTIGASAFSGCTSLTSVNKANQVSIPDSVETIEGSAFYGCTSITTVSIGEEGATTIGASAFSGCTSLTIVSIGGEGTIIGTSAFEGCSALTTLTLKEGVKTIGNSSFLDNSSLLAVNIPASVTSIGSSAFKNTSSLTKVTIADESLLTTIGTAAFRDSGLVEFKFAGSSSLETINANAFYNCNDLSKWGTDDADKVLIPEGTLTIGSGAFAYLDDVTDIIVADSVTSVGDETFRGCKSLINLTMPKVFGTAPDAEVGYSYSGVWTVNGNDFSYSGTGTSYREEKVTFNYSGVVNLEYYVSATNYVTCYILKNGSSLYSVSGTTTHKVSEISVSIGDYLTFRFYNSSSSYSRGAYVHMDYSIDSSLGVLFGKSIYENSYADSEGTNKHYIPSSLKTVTITTDNIPSKSFYGFTSLIRVNIPNDATSIGNYAFYKCSALKSINGDYIVRIPASMESIGNYAFAACTAITAVSIGDGDGMTIGEFAFNNCSSLAIVTTGDNITSIGSSAFKDCVLLAKVNSNVTGHVVLPSGLTTVQTYAFKNCDLLTDITFGPNITTLALSSFNGCTNIAKATFSFDGNGWNSNPSLATVFADSISNLTEIAVSAGKAVPANMFENMSNIEKITLPGTLETIGSNAFANCTALSKINSNEEGKAILPNTVKQISESAFLNCTGLTDFNTGESLEIIGNSAFSGCSNIVRFNSNVDGHMVLPAFCTSLGTTCFSGMTGITDVTVDDYIASVGNGSFALMSNLVNITLPFVGSNIKATSGNYLAPFGYIFGYATTSTSVESKDGYIYSGITSNSQKYWYRVPTSLRTVTITVQTQIPAYAFYNCSMLTNIYTPNSVTSTGSYAYTNCPATVTNSVVPVVSSPWNGSSVAGSFHSGDGSQANPYVIFDGNELKYLANQVNSGTSYENKYFVLTCDIDLNSMPFPTIGDNDHPFLGNINGHGYYIKNIKIAGTTKYVGMFGYLGGTLEHLGFFSGTITSTVSGNDNYYAGLVACLTSTGSISNVYSHVTVSISGAFYEYAGGIAGYVDGGSIVNCFSRGNISATNANLFAYAGGIAGYLNAGSINGCYSYGNITANGSALTYSRNGQIVGDKAENTTVANCYRYSGATLTRYSSSGSVYNTDGTADTESSCLAAVKSLWDNTKWRFTGNVPALKII